MKYLSTSTILLETKETTIPTYVGFICLCVSIFFYGSFLVPVKKFDTGDGVSFQLLLCIGIWTVGLVVNCIRNFPQFYALPLLGGFFWTLGNITSVPIINLIGLSVGMLIWGTVSLITGWANARFGWFGIKPQVPNSIALNYAGVALAAMSGMFYFFVKPETKATNVEIEVAAAEQTTDTLNKKIEMQLFEKNKINLRLFKKLKLSRVIGSSMAIFAGIMYGVAYTPYIYVVDNYENASENALDYVFSMYSGILIASIFFFITYCIYKKNKPVINVQVMLPGFISGVIWGCANSFFLIANSALSQTVTFPIGASGPPIVASLYGILLYKEVKGKRNIIILLIGFSVGITGSILSGLSK